MQRIAPVLLALALAAPASAATPRPDLTVRSVGALPVATAAPGARVALTETTRNRGLRTARASRTAWYLSTDRRRSRGDRRLARRAVRSLRPRRSSRRRTTVTLPSRLGTFFLIACADDARRVRERSERNNCRASAAALRIDFPVVGPAPPPPDGSAGGGTGSGDGGPGVVNPAAPPPVVGGCQIFPADNAWNRDISGDEVDPASSTYIKHMTATPGDDWNLRLDMGSSEEFYGIPWTLVPQNQPLITLQYGVGSFPDYEDSNDGAYENYDTESDPGPFPIPPEVHIESGSAADPDPTDGDRHTIVIRQGDCMLFETYKTVRERNAANEVVSFQVASSADWDLNVNDTRPAGWTSADAAGLPIFPGLLRHEEILAGAINHALRFTAPRAQQAYTAPASHFGPYSDTCKPPYGLRMRLKADYDETPYSEEGRVLIRALKRFGLMYADQGSSGFVSGTSNPALESLIEEINQTRRIPHTAFEVVKLGEIERGFPDAPCADP